MTYLTIRNFLIVLELNVAVRLISVEKGSANEVYVSRYCTSQSYGFAFGSVTFQPIGNLHAHSAPKGERMGLVALFV